MRKLNLDILKKGLDGISKTIGTFLRQAAIACLVKQGHKSGVILNVSGEFEEDFELIWKANSDDESLEGWEDINEATEYAASAIALLLILKLTDFQHFKRMRQDEIGDYLIKIASADIAFSYLEISGIFKETLQNSIRVRIRSKQNQIAKKSSQKLELYTIVTEFGQPKSKINRNELS